MQTGSQMSGILNMFEYSLKMSKSYFLIYTRFILTVKNELITVSWAPIQNFGADTIIFTQSCKSIKRYIYTECHFIYVIMFVRFTVWL